MKKETFVSLVETVNQYFNGDISKALDILDICESRITDLFDTILNTLEEDMDPDGMAVHDEKAEPGGSYIYCWLFDIGDMRKTCPTIESLYDYIMSNY